MGSVQGRRVALLCPKFVLAPGSCCTVCRHRNPNPREGEEEGGGAKSTFSCGT